MNRTHPEVMSSERNVSTLVTDNWHIAAFPWGVRGVLNEGILKGVHDEGGPTVRGSKYSGQTDSSVEEILQVNQQLILI